MHSYKIKMMSFIVPQVSAKTTICKRTPSLDYYQGILVDFSYILNNILNLSYLSVLFLEIHDILYLKLFHFTVYL
jgi:hypothetical protein